MKNEYFNKQEFIKDFIDLCRKLRKEHQGHQTGFIHKFLIVCGELWRFYIYIDRKTISTSAERIYDATKRYDLDSIPVRFPKTTWGSPYSRWDSELREFLEREICK